MQDELKRILDDPFAKSQVISVLNIAIIFTDEE